MWHYLRFQKYPQNTIKMGKTVKKRGPVFNFKLGPVLNFKTPKLGTSLNIYFCSPKAFSAKALRNCRNKALRGTKNRKSFFQLKCWICWMCSWRVSKNVLLNHNVEYVDYVECFLNLQTLPGAPQKKNNIQRYSCEKHFFQKCASFNGNVEYVECVLGTFSKKCFFLGNV